MTISPLLNWDPQWLGGYRLTGRLGGGGFGTVFSAVDSDDEPVAIKMLRPELALDDSLRQRLASEGEAMRRVSSPRTVEILEVSTSGDVAFLVMELVDGAPLDQHISKVGPLHGPILWFTAEGMAEALSAIHHAGIVHRDLKPSNVMIGPNGVKVLDFGISVISEQTAHTATGAFLGSAAWISPEQANGAPATTASDVFTLGLLLAFASTGAHPFGSGRADAVMFRISHSDPDLSAVPATLRDTVAACLGRDPARRPSAADLFSFFAAGGANGLVLPGDQPSDASAYAVGPDQLIEPPLDQPSSHGSGKSSDERADGTLVIEPVPRRPTATGDPLLATSTGVRRPTRIAAALAVVAAVLVAIVMFTRIGDDKAMGEDQTTSTQRPILSSTATAPVTTVPVVTTSTPTSPSTTSPFLAVMSSAKLSSITASAEPGGVVEIVMAVSESAGVTDVTFSGRRSSSGRVAEWLAASYRLNSGTGVANHSVQVPLDVEIGEYIVEVAFSDRGGETSERVDLGSFIVTAPTTTSAPPPQVAAPLPTPATTAPMFNDPPVVSPQTLAYTSVLRGSTISYAGVFASDDNGIASFAVSLQGVGLGSHSLRCENQSFDPPQLEVRLTVQCTIPTDLLLGEYSVTIVFKDQFGSTRGMSGRLLVFSS